MNPDRQIYFEKRLYFAELYDIILGPSFKYGFDIMRIEMKSNIQDTQKEEERRKFFRVDLIKRVRYKILGFTSIECFTQNISEGGLCLLIGKDLFPGMTVKVEFALPGNNSKIVRANAVVVWQRNYLTGVKFIS